MECLVRLQHGDEYAINRLFIVSETGIFPSIPMTQIEGDPGFANAYTMQYRGIEIAVDALSYASNGVKSARGTPRPPMRGRRRGNQPLEGGRRSTDPPRRGTRGCCAPR